MAGSRKLDVLLTIFRIFVKIEIQKQHNKEQSEPFKQIEFQQINQFPQIEQSCCHFH